MALYSYSAEFGLTKNLEECFEDIRDMGAHGIEILANTHIENYPYPSDEWVERWHRLCDKYEIVPVEYGNWIDSHVLGSRDLLTELVTNLCDNAIRYNRPGGHVEPVENWREIITGALPLAQELDIRMCPEIHTPSNLKGKLVAEYVDFIQRTGTKHFGLNIDFSVFRTEFAPGEWVDPNYEPNKPEDIIPLLPYIYCCHAKFIHMSDDFQETTIPYPQVIRILQEQGWDGYLLSEYEGADKYDPGYEVGQTLRKQHIMLKRLLGD